MAALYSSLRAMRPIGILNIDGFFDPLLSCIDHMIEQRFLPPAHREMLLIENSADVLLERFEGHHPVSTPKWL